MKTRQRALPCSGPKTWQGLRPSFLPAELYQQPPGTSPPLPPRSHGQCSADGFRSGLAKFLGNLVTSFFLWSPPAAVLVFPERTEKGDTMTIKEVLDELNKLIGATGNIDSDAVRNAARETLVDTFKRSPRCSVNEEAGGEDRDDAPEPESGRKIRPTRTVEDRARAVFAQADVLVAGCPGVGPCPPGRTPPPDRAPPGADRPVADGPGRWRRPLSGRPRSACTTPHRG